MTLLLLVSACGTNPPPPPPTPAPTPAAQPAPVASPTPRRNAEREAQLEACTCRRPVEPQPPYVVLLPNLDGSAGQVFVKGGGGAQTLNAVGTGANLDGVTPPFVVPPAQILRDFGAAMGAKPITPDVIVLSVQTGKVSLTPEAMNLLPTILDKVKARASPDVSITGHSDTKGDTEANTKLAMRRAEAVAALLKQRGMSPASLVIDSHGDKNPLVPTPPQTDEPRNRRVEVTIR